MLKPTVRPPSFCTGVDQHSPPATQSTIPSAAIQLVCRMPPWCSTCRRKKLPFRPKWTWLHVDWFSYLLACNFNCILLHLLYDCLVSFHSIVFILTVFFLNSNFDFLAAADYHNLNSAERISHTVCLQHFNNINAVFTLVWESLQVLLSLHCHHSSISPSFGHFFDPL